MGSSLSTPVYSPPACKSDYEYLVLSLGTMTDGTKVGWGVSWSDTYGQSNCRMIGTQEQATAKYTEMMKPFPHWIRVTDIDGGLTAFDPAKSTFEPASSFYRHGPKHRPLLGVAVYGIHPYCLEVTPDEFNKKAALFKGYTGEKDP